MSWPEDYVDDYNRGTVNFDSAKYNYSFHKVNIPQSTVVDSCNFTQYVADTDAILGNYEITFMECNLTNVLINPLWVLINCNTSSFDFSEE